MQYNARVEYDERDPVDEQLLDALADYHPATARSPFGRVEVIITVPAVSLRQATLTALSVAGDAHTAPVVAFEVMSTAEFDERLGLTRLPELVSVTEAAAKLGVTRQAVLQRLESGSLPGQKVGNNWVVEYNALMTPEERLASFKESTAANMAAIPEIEKQRRSQGR
jgi:excisionase family DNA binding protein